MAVEGRFCDSGIAVREAALELVGRHIASHPDVGLKVSLNFCLASSFTLCTVTIIGLRFGKIGLFYSILRRSLKESKILE